MKNRYFHVGLKRWISSDPLGIEGGVNLYAYANGNPQMFLDPWGLGGAAAGTFNVDSVPDWDYSMFEMVYDGIPSTGGYGADHHWYSDSAVWASAAWGASEGAAAAPDGIIPFGDPLDFVYADPSGEIPLQYEVSQVAGAATIFIETVVLGPLYAGSQALGASSVTAGAATRWLVGSYGSISTHGTATRIVGG
ncbi:MAG: RHS repeat-associated core domain-containing protein [Kiritimatiellia bacterium]|jgi:hypothetical protein|nr:RHS repeat-associated core domain-containing protein [Kiritimatiellia bacterium]